MTLPIPNKSSRVSPISKMRRGHWLWYWTILGLSTINCALAASENGWICKQSSSRYGSLTCYVTPHNFRMDAMDLRLYVKPPFREVTMYNMDGKLKYTVSIDNISSRISIRTLTTKDKKKGIKEAIVKQGKRNIAGFDCDEYLSYHIDPRGAKRPRVLIYATRGLNLPKAMEIACAKLTDCPPGLGFPVRLQIYEGVSDQATKIRGYRLQQMLNTNKAEQSKVDDQMFIEPSGFKAARDEMEIMMGAPPP